MKYKNIKVRREEVVSIVMKWLSENGFICGEPFRVDDIWHIPYMATNKEQKEKVEGYLEFMWDEGMFW